MFINIIILRNKLIKEDSSKLFLFLKTKIFYVIHFIMKLKYFKRLLEEEGKAIYLEGANVSVDVPLGTVKILVDKLNIRNEPSLQGTIRSTTQTGRIYPVYEIVHADGYDWYRIGKNKFIASKEEEWTTYTEANAASEGND